MSPSRNVGCRHSATLFVFDRSRESALRSVERAAGWRRVPLHRRAAAGFTLLELLVALVIIGALVGYVGPKYFDQLGKSEKKIARAQVDAIEKALDTYRLDVGRYPTTEQGLAALSTRPGEEARWNGPYLKKALPADPWGKPYQYRNPGEHGIDVDVFSFGKDGQPGGDGDAADIGNWN
jgi:general secretion pathway protein G